MCTKLVDLDVILSGNEEWTQLEEKWGKPIDLDTEEDLTPELKSVFSTLDLMTSTFDSSFLFKKVRRKVGRQLSKGVIDYNDFIQDLQESDSQKQFYFINGQILSAVSVENICGEIDEIFKSVEKLCSATSTICKKFPEVRCSILTGGLAFDDTVSEKEKSDSDDIDKFIDEAFEKLGNLSCISDDEATKASVTTLVKKFSSILSSPTINCSPRRRRECCEKFKELVEFWNNRAFDQEV